MQKRRWRELLKSGGNSERSRFLQRPAEDEECAAGDERKAHYVVPGDRLLEIEDREAGEHDQRDHLLHGLQLRRRIDLAAPAVGRHREPVFEERDAPARLDS